jgi:hypothetical protein
MATDHILTLLLAERDKLTAAIEALQGPSTTVPGPARKAVQPPVEQDSTPSESPTPARRVKRKLSEAGRQAIIAGTKKRWADIKAQKAAASAPAAASPAKQKAPTAKNAAFRKKMSDRMNAAWAARRKKAAGKAKG